MKRENILVYMPSESTSTFSVKCVKSGNILELEPSGGQRQRCYLDCKG
jgi:hypothetical protein